VRLAIRVNDAESRWTEIVLLDDDPGKVGKSILGVHVAGPFELLGRADPELDEVQNLVARTTSGRSAARGRIEGYGIPFATLISPNVDTEGVQFSNDIIVYQNVTLGPETTVEASSVFFMGAVIGHESHVGVGCVVASNAVLNARVRLGEGVYVGTSAVVLPEVSIGAGATVGAGTVVVHDIPAGATAFGVPAEVVLPGEPPDAPERQSESQASMRAVEKTIAAIWRKETGADSIGLDDNFFDAGGSSLTALRALVAINAGMHSELTISDVYRFPTVRTLAAHLTTRQRSSAVHEGELRGAIRRRYSGWDGYQ
jgi:acetyltransferase-like isoleucine patch superfamily enzyme/acyl carrier protein